MTGLTDAYISKLPKAELHLHLEGAVTPAILSELGSKYATGTTGEAVSEVFEFPDFYSFLGSYKVVCEHLRAPEDYVTVFEALQSYFLAEHIVYAEILYTPSIPWKYGRDGKEILEALIEASSRFQMESGVQVRWILDNVRQFGREAAERTAALACDFVSKGVVGIGLGGDEKSLEMKEFEEVFSWARAHQLFSHVHAGEIGGPDQVWDAILLLGANRIGHGIHAARDSKLMQYLKEHVIALDVCLTSNQKTKAWPILATHPCDLLLKRGVPVTLNTDDPGLFQTGLNAEYAKAAQTFHLGAEELSRIALQGLHSAFLPHAEKMALMHDFQSEIRNLNQSLS